MPLPPTWRSASIRSATLHGLHLLELLSNPNGPSPKEQEQTLLLELRMAKNAKQVAMALLNSRQQTDNPALQSTASDTQALE